MASAAGRAASRAWHAKPLGPVCCHRWMRHQRSPLVGTPTCHRSLARPDSTARLPLPAKTLTATASDHRPLPLPTKTPTATPSRHRLRQQPAATTHCHHPLPAPAGLPNMDSAAMCPMPDPSTPASPGSGPDDDAGAHAPVPARSKGWPLWLRIGLAVVILSFVWSPFLAMLLRLSRLNPSLQPTGGTTDFTPPEPITPRAAPQGSPLAPQGSSPAPAVAPPAPAPNP